MSELTVHPAVASGYGLVEAPFERVIDLFGSHRRADQSEVRHAETTTDAAKMLKFLDTRTVPATRLVVVEHGAWTAILTNHRNGSDFADHQFWAARTLRVRSVRVVDHEARWWRGGGRRERLSYAARIVELAGPDGETIRSIACADDGHWVFETFGDPLPIEATFDYSAPRKRDRFTSANLNELLRSIGAEPLTPEALLRSRRFGLLIERITNAAWRERVDDEACTLAQADDPAFGYWRHGLNYVPHIKTHATSVIAAFEKAIAIDPSYEARVRPLLEQARRIAGKQN
ncbi:MAG TPA: hypothetical protein VJ850_00590 [Candidatus Limnocylindrales bacterium]|nr:hypothetical protein [Candidatus Limnocylindrales bacterium]